MQRLDEALDKNFLKTTGERKTPNPQKDPQNTVRNNVILHLIDPLYLLSNHKLRLCVNLGERTQLQRLPLQGTDTNGLRSPRG